MTWQCVKCDASMGMQIDACGQCGAERVSVAERIERGNPIRIRYSTRSLLLAMTALAPTFLLSPLVWQQILMALAIGSIATAVGIFLTRTLIDGKAVLRLPVLRPGEHRLRVAYGGSSKAKAATSSAVVLRVRR